MYLIGALLWGTVCWFIARSISRLVGSHFNIRWLPQVLTWVITPLIFISPLADEIIAKPQYERLCATAKEVKIYATHPVGEELYTPDGKWRRSDDREESNRLNALYESLVRWDFGSIYPGEIPAATIIRKTHTRIYDRTDGRLLAEWDAYGTPGGWLGRHLGGSILLAPSCSPKRDNLNYLILPFIKKTGDQK